MRLFWLSAAGQRQLSWEVARWIVLLVGGRVAGQRKPARLDSTATAPVQKQFIFREGGGARILIFEAHLFLVKKRFGI